MSNGDLSLEVQQAIFTRLSEDTVLQSPEFLGGKNVFDHVPDQQPPNFICISGATWQDWGDKTDPGQTGVFPVRCWTRDKGNKRALLIARRVVALLHEQTLPLVAGQAVLVRFTNGGDVPDADGVSIQAYRNFKIIVSDPPTDS